MTTITPEKQKEWADALVASFDVTMKYARNEGDVLRGDINVARIYLLMREFYADPTLVAITVDALLLCLAGLLIEMEKAGGLGPEAGNSFGADLLHQAATSAPVDELRTMFTNLNEPATNQKRGTE